MRRAVWLLLGSVVCVGILLLFVFPTRTLLQQDREIAAVHRQIAALQAENATLHSRAAALRQPATIERLARQDFGLVMPGQKAYAVLPAPAPAPPVGRHAPAAPRHGHHPWWEVWRDL